MGFYFFTFYKLKLNYIVEEFWRFKFHLLRIDDFLILFSPCASKYMQFPVFVIVLIMVVRLVSS